MLADAVEYKGMTTPQIKTKKNEQENFIGDGISLDSKIGKSFNPQLNGMAHFCEHMIFMGSRLMQIP